MGLGFQSLKYQPSTGLFSEGKETVNSSWTVLWSLHTLDGDFSVLKAFVLWAVGMTVCPGFRDFHFHTVKSPLFLFQGDYFQRWPSLISYRLRVHPFTPAAVLREVSDPALLSPVTFQQSLAKGCSPSRSR